MAGSLSIVHDASAPTAQRDSGARRFRERLRRSLREFATMPLLVIGLLLLLAAASIVADQSHLSMFDAPRRMVGHVIGKQAASTTLQAIATGLVTVTSITFSMLLLAVQQTASSLSPVVFDQFVRRRSNQIFLGFFVGLALYSYVVMAAVQDGTPPILGAALATVLTVAALAILLILVYTTIDQMRPASVVRKIHDRTLVAYRRESRLLARTRRRAEGHHPVSATFRCRTTGYVIGIDLDRLSRALRDIPDTEIRLRVTMGQHLAFGDVVAEVSDDQEARARWLAEQVRQAVVIGPDRDLDYDPRAGVDELGNIAWTSGSTAKQNPEIARQSLHTLRDLAARWMLEHDEDRPRAEPLAVVYRDDVLDRLLEVVYSMLVAAHESHQHMASARVLEVYESLLVHADGPTADRLLRDLATAQSLLDEMPPSAALDEVRERLDRRDRRRGSRAGERA